MKNIDSTIINQQVDLLLDQSGISNRNDKLIEFLNTVTDNSKIDLPVITKIVNNLLLIDKHKQCKTSQSLNQRFLVFLRDYFIKFLFNEEINKFITKLSTLF